MSTHSEETPPITKGNSRPLTLERLQPVFQALDTISRCGFCRSGIHEVHGNPGAGKTNLVNQMLVMPRPARKPFSSRVD
jgi:predicted ATP-dependent serine protease